MFSQNPREWPNSNFGSAIFRSFMITPLVLQSRFWVYIVHMLIQVRFWVHIGRTLNFNFSSGNEFNQAWLMQAI